MHSKQKLCASDYWWGPHLMEPIGEMRRPCTGYGTLCGRGARLEARPCVYETIAT